MLQTKHDVNSKTTFASSSIIKEKIQFQFHFEYNKI
jgi:hypothetical protein